MTGSKYHSLIETSSIQGSNAVYVEDLYEQYLDDPNQVDPEWRAYFRNVQGHDGGNDTAHGPIRAQFEKLAREPKVAVANQAVPGDLVAAEKQLSLIHI